MPDPTDSGAPPSVADWTLVIGLDVDRWSGLLWCNGRIALPGHPKPVGLVLTPPREGLIGPTGRPDLL